MCTSKTKGPIVSMALRATLATFPFSSSRPDPHRFSGPKFGIGLAVVAKRRDDENSRNVAVMASGRHNTPPLAARSHRRPSKRCFDGKARERAR